MTNSIADLYVVLDSVTDPFSRGLKSAASDAEAQSGRMSAALGAVAKIGLGVGAAVIGIGAASVKAAGDFQTQMTRLYTAAGAPKAAVQGASDQILKLGASVGMTGTQMAEALYHPVSAGLDLATSLQVVKYAAEEAQISGASLDNTTYSLSSVMKAFGQSGDQAATTMAQLNAIVGQGDTHFEDFNASIKNWAPTAAAMGISITSIGSAIGYLTDRGNSAEEASTRLTMGLSMMATPSKQAASLLEGLGVASSDVKGSTDAMTQVLKQTGITQNQLAADLQKPDGIYVALTHLKTALNDAGVKGTEADSAIAKIFGGGRSDKAILSLLQDLGGLQDKFNKVTADSTTSKFEANWEDAQKTFQVQIDKIKAGAENLGVELGTKLLPVLSDVLSRGESAVGQIASGFTGAATAPVAHPNLGNARLNEIASQPPPLTGWQQFGQQTHQVFEDLLTDAKKLEPVGLEFVQFGEGAYQAFTKIVSAARPTAELLGHGLFDAFGIVGKVLVDVVEPPLKWFADFLDSHKTLVEVFAVGAIGLLGTKMAILGGIDAAKGLVNLATAIVQFPMSQTNEIKDAFAALKAAYTGRDAADGEQAIRGLKGAVDDLKASAGGMAGQVAGMFDGYKMAGITAAADSLAAIDTQITALETTAEKAPEQLSLFETSLRGVVQPAATEQLSLFEADMNGIVQVAERSPTQLGLFETALGGMKQRASDADAETAKLTASLTGLVSADPSKLITLADATENVALGAGNAETAVGKMADAETTAAGEAETAAGKAGKFAGVLGDFGVVGGVVGAAIGGIALLTGVISTMNTVGDHTADTFGQISDDLDLVTKGSQSAERSVAQFAAQLGAMYAQSQTGRHATGEPAGLSQLDQALAQMVSSGHVQDAQQQFDAISQAFEANGLNADYAARMFPQYEKAVGHAGDVAQTTDGKIQDLTNSLGVSQSLTQFNSDVLNLTQSLKENGKTLDSNSTAGQANQMAFQQAASGILDFYNKQRAAGVGTAAATQTMYDQVQQIEALGSQFGIGKGDVDKFLGSLGLIKPEYGTTVDVNTAPAIDGLHALLAGINASHASVHVDIVSSGSPTDVKKTSNPQLFALGGWVDAPVGQPVPAVVHGGEFVISTDMQAGRAPIDPRALGATALRGGGASVGGYTALTGSGGGASVVNNYFYAVNVAGSAVTQAKLEDVLRTQVLQYKGRNSSNGWG